ncbi:hypothetical protein NQ314_019975 [Rhamnusium bicolor]|uniref:Uncharacterized protein n=1 Tax=Rhamnusium bicolor TaxID=1586634 RepID=A0AAV8WMX7_9CUCU|nr:hypothetical protein NQ314_019975 [Rhamnusium bicolor]
MKNLKKSLTDLEIHLANRLTIVEVSGKSRKNFKVSILLTPNMKQAIDKLIETRHLVDIDINNPFVFARGHKSLGYLRGHDCLRKCCSELDLKEPRLITSTKLRKYITTVVQVFDLKETEVDWLARHLGHNIRIHREFYRLHESAVEITKISRLLLAIDNGNVNKFAGKSLSEITIQKLPDIDMSDSETEEEPITNELRDCKKTDPKVTNIKSKAVGSNQGNKKAAEKIPVANRQQAKKVTSKRPWSAEEKKCVMHFFRSNIKNNIVPNKKQAEECLENHKDVLQYRSWKDIKYCVPQRANVAHFS